MGEKKNGNEPGGVRTVGSVAKLFSIIEYMEESGGAGVTELAKELSLSKGATHRYLSTLVSNDYAKNIDGRYRLTHKFLRIGTAVRQQLPYNELVAEKLEQLGQESGERAQYLVPESERCVYVFRERGTHAVRTGSRVGESVYLHQSAAGKAILAHLPESERNKILNKGGLPESTEKTITDREKLVKELEEIREKGYALNRGEYIENLWAVGAPIETHEDKVLGAISVSGPVHRLQDRIESGEIPRLVLGTASEIELTIKHHAVKGVDS